MHRYKFFFLDDHGHVLRGQDHMFRDDVDALAAAEKFCNEHAVEIWQGIREVARVKRNDEALSASDRRSL
jgi:hypothetical protein